MGCASKPHATYGKRAWPAGRRPAAKGGILNITAAVWTAGFHWWRSGDKRRTQNVSEYMPVLALCLVYVVCVHLLKKTLIIFSRSNNWRKLPCKNQTATYLTLASFSTIRFSALESIRYMKIVAMRAKIMILWKQQIPLKLHVLFLSHSSGHLHWTQKRLRSIFGYWLSGFIIFTVRHHTVKNQKCQLMWFVTGARKYSWHATTHMCQHIWRNGYWKHFGDKTVKNQTCQFMPYLTKCPNMYILSVCV